MIKVLIPYGTTEGQTARIAEYLANVIRGHGYAAYPVDLSDSSLPVLDRYDAALVGATVEPSTSGISVVAGVR